MGTKLGDLTSAIMTASNNTDVAPWINTWANWAIQEIWTDRPWPFRVREIPAGTINQGDTKIQLPLDFDLPREFRILGDPPTGRKLFRMTDEVLRRRVSNPDDPTLAGTPKWWLDPILSDTFDANGNTIYSLRFHPMSDDVYTFGGSYFCDHPILDVGGFIMIPTQYMYVVVDRLRIYLKEFEDEMDITPWENKYKADLNGMRNDLGRHLDALPSWKTERYLEQIDRAALSFQRDVDIGE